MRPWGLVSAFWFQCPFKLWIIRALIAHGLKSSVFIYVHKTNTSARDAEKYLRDFDLPRNQRKTKQATSNASSSQRNV